MNNQSAQSQSNNCSADSSSQSQPHSSNSLAVAVGQNAYAPYASYPGASAVFNSAFLQPNQAAGIQYSYAYPSSQFQPQYGQQYYSPHLQVAGQAHPMTSPANQMPSANFQTSAFRPISRDQMTSPPGARQQNGPAAVPSTPLMVTTTASSYLAPFVGASAFSTAAAYLNPQQHAPHVPYGVNEPSIVRISGVPCIPAPPENNSLPINNQMVAMHDGGMAYAPVAAAVSNPAIIGAQQAAMVSYYQQAPYFYCVYDPFGQAQILQGAPYAGQQGFVQMPQQLMPAANGFNNQQQQPCSSNNHSIQMQAQGAAVRAAQTQPRSVSAAVPPRSSAIPFDPQQSPAAQNSVPLLAILEPKRESVPPAASGLISSQPSTCGNQQIQSLSSTSANHQSSASSSTPQTREQAASSEPATTANQDSPALAQTSQPIGPSLETNADKSSCEPHQSQPASSVPAPYESPTAPGILLASGDGGLVEAQQAGSSSQPPATTTPEGVSGIRISKVESLAKALNAPSTSAAVQHVSFEDGKITCIFECDERFLEADIANHIATSHGNYACTSSARGNDRTIEIMVAACKKASEDKNTLTGMQYLTSVLQQTQLKIGEHSAPSVSDDNDQARVADWVQTVNAEDSPTEEEGPETKKAKLGALPKTPKKEIAIKPEKMEAGSSSSRSQPRSTRKRNASDQQRSESRLTRAKSAAGMLDQSATPVGGSAFRAPRLRSGTRYGPDPNANLPQAIKREINSAVRAEKRIKKESDNEEDEGSSSVSGRGSTPGHRYSFRRSIGPATRFVNERKSRYGLRKESKKPRNFYTKMFLPLNSDDDDEEQFKYVAKEEESSGDESERKGDVKWDDGSRQNKSKTIKRDADDDKKPEVRRSSRRLATVASSSAEPYAGLSRRMLRSSAVSPPEAKPDIKSERQAKFVKRETETIPERNLKRLRNPSGQSDDSKAAVGEVNVGGRVAKLPVQPAKEKRASSRAASKRWKSSASIDNSRTSGAVNVEVPVDLLEPVPVSAEDKDEIIDLTQGTDDDDDAELQAALALSAVASLSKHRDDHRATTPNLNEELKPLTLVWTKLSDTLWYPGLLIDPSMPPSGIRLSHPNGVFVDAPPANELAKHMLTAASNPYLVHLFTEPERWISKSADCLELFNVDENLDLQRRELSVSKNERHLVRAAYFKAMSHLSLVDANQPDSTSKKREKKRDLKPLNSASASASSTAKKSIETSGMLDTSMVNSAKSTTPATVVCSTATVKLDPDSDIEVITDEPGGSSTDDKKDVEKKAKTLLGEPALLCQFANCGRAVKVDKLRVHVFRHLINPPFQCAYCRFGSRFGSKRAKSVIRKHIEEEHDGKDVDIKDRRKDYKSDIEQLHKQCFEPPISAASVAPSGGNKSDDEMEDLQPSGLSFTPRSSAAVSSKNNSSATSSHQGVCQICKAHVGDDFLTQTNHVWTHCAKREWSCGRCEFSAMTHNEIREHIVASHSDGRMVPTDQTEYKAKLREAGLQFQL